MAPTCLRRRSGRMSPSGHSRPMHSVAVPINVRCYSNSEIIIRRSEVTLRAMYGRRPRCKMNLAFCEAFGCSHVSGLFSRGGLPRCDAAVMAAGPDVIR